MRALLRGGWLPSDTNKCPVNESSFGARPLAHAMARSLIEVGGSSSEFSTSSATARSAIAYALLIASSLLFPYASAPGTSGISAIHRPSVSRSISMLNCKSLLVLRGGFAPVVTIWLGCPKASPVAPYQGNF
jgi:hypothetical protein